MFASLVMSTPKASAYALTYYCFTLLIGGYYSQHLEDWIAWSRSIFVLQPIFILYFFFLLLFFP